MKVCSECGIEKPTESFHRDRRAKGGRSYHCKDCVRERGRRWRQANADRKRSNNRAWALANPDKVAASQDKYRRANPEVYSTALKKYRTENAERLRERGREKYRANPDYYRDFSRRSAANRRVVMQQHVDPLVVLEQHDGVCGVCGGDVDPTSFHMDHIIPLARGGAHSYGNTQPTHPACNLAKWATTSDEAFAEGELHAVLF